MLRLRPVCAVVALLLSVPTLGRPAGAAPSSVDAARAALEASDLDAAQRQVGLDHLEAAAAQEREAATLAERLQALQAEVAGSPKRLDDLLREIEVDRPRLLAEWTARLPADADGETLEALLQREQAEVDTLRAERETAGGELARALSPPAEANGDVAGLRQRVDELSIPLVRAESEPNAVFEARSLRRAAELRRVQAELAFRTAEQESLAGRQRYLELRLRGLGQRIRMHEARIAVLQTRVAEVGRRNLERSVARLATDEVVPAGDRVMAEAVAENQAIGRELLEQNDLLGRERAALVELEEARARVQDALLDTRTRLELGGASEQVGRWLWSERQQLPSPLRLRQRRAALSDELAALRLRLVMLVQQERELLDAAAVAAALRAADAAATDDETQAEQVAGGDVEAVLRDRRELLGLLEPLVRRRLATLEQSERVLGAQLESTVALREMLDRRLLWIRSHAPIDRVWMGRVPEGLIDLTKPSRLLTTLELVGRDLRARPARWGASLLLLVLAFVVRRPARRRLTELGAATRQIRQDRYRYTVEALGWTLLAATPAPLAMLLVGLLLQGVGASGRFSDSLGRTLVAFVVPAFLVTFLWWASIEQGLAHAHFRWMRSRREAIRTWLPRLAAVLFPLGLVIQLAFVRNQDLAIDVSARLALVLAFGFTAVVLWRLLDAGRLWVVRGVPAADASPVRRALRFALPGVLVAGAVLALSGWVYPAASLFRAAFTTFGVVLVVATVVGMLGRWFVAGERRLKLKRLDEQRAAAAQAGEHGEVAPDLDADLSVETVSAQTGRLLRALRWTLLAVGLAWAWSEVLLAFTRLDEIVLWSVTDTGADGQAVVEPVTLMAALLGGLALALTVVGARNLPGLVEIGLLSRTGVDAGARYAITSVLRYAIVGVGALAGFGLLGLRWSQLQWLAAALSVGLGFGLQEIFANFVSGLILLFERPFRVGDVITIGALSGRVTRIRTRATTIVDGENREIVVPNKSFITGDLINWTLSDTTTKVTLNVRVAYGSNPDTVRTLLRRAAVEHPRVLAEPAPDSHFIGFGESALDFELGVHVGTLGDRGVVRDDINTRIAVLFAEHGIALPFPQLDVHLRDVPPPAPEGRRDDA